ncbi:porin family protein [Ruegeria profundi]|uniref:porin family protein n=1 Tax=Ruegeria profundi TaxID=1685378 RepID=UPI001CD5A624|nr:porin family protein [Ruegeria profundi]MCA0930386.1 porin family protein [Ruegeria profundi]
MIIRKTGLRNFLSAVGALAASATVANAQDGRWTYAASIYLFAAETTTQIGSVESKLSFSDALENLDMAFMGAFEASNDQWSFGLDYMYTNLGFTGDTPGNVFSSAETSLKTQILTGFVAYRVLENQNASVDVAGGFRYFDTETELNLVGGPPVPSVTASEDWIDPIIGVRANMRFSDRWSGTAFLDYGGFDGDSETWQVLLSADYALNENWDLRFGYRYLDVENTISGTDFSFEQSGPIFGATYRF